MWRGKRVGLGRSAEYTDFRATLPGDANVIGYVSPHIGDVLSKQVQAGSPAAVAPTPLPVDPSLLNSYKNLPGGAFSIAVREAGLHYDMTTQMKGRQMDALRQMATLDPKIVSRVPADALGFMAIAQPGALYDATEAALTDMPPDARRTWNEGKEKFEAESGLSIANDIRPALNGDVVVAFYEGDETVPLHFSGLVTDARQSQPAALLEKVQAAIKKQDGTVEFIARSEGSVTYWAIPRAVTEKARMDEPLKSLHTRDGQQVNLYATVGQSAFAASSRVRLEGAVQTYQDGNGFKPTNPLPANVQMLAVIRPRLIIDGIARRSPETFRAGAISADDASAIWGDQDIVLSGSYGPKYATGTAFIPLQYENIIKQVARAARDAKTSKNTSRQDVLAL